MSVIGSAAQLVVEFVGDERVLTPPGDELTFGRAADLVIDDNRYLHRVLGRFGVGQRDVVAFQRRLGDPAGDGRHRGVRRSSGSRRGATVPIPFGSATLGFEAGGRTYELRVEVLSELSGFGLDPAAVDVDADGSSAELTTTASSLPLSDEQRLLLVALAEPRLRDMPGSEQMPTNRQIAHMFGWTITKFNRKLDGLCIKYAAAGIGGLRGSSDLLAKDRRVRLTDHVVHAGIITAADLPLLSRPPPPLTTPPASPVGVEGRPAAVGVEGDGGRVQPLVAIRAAREVGDDGPRRRAPRPGWRHRASAQPSSSVVGTSPSSSPSSSRSIVGQRGPRRWRRSMQRDQDPRRRWRATRRTDR